VVGDFYPKWGYKRKVYMGFSLASLTNFAENGTNENKSFWEKAGDFFASGKAAEIVQGVKNTVSAFGKSTVSNSGNTFQDTFSNIDDSAKVGSFFKQYGMLLLVGAAFFALLVVKKKV